jgi:hypothetical protein
MLRKEAELMQLDAALCNVLGSLGWLKWLDWSYLTILGGGVLRGSPHYLVEQKRKVTPSFRTSPVKA